MSHQAVIEAFVTRLADIDASPAVPFVDTLNSRPETRPDIYLSLDRDYATTYRVTLGPPSMFREQGTLQVVVTVRSGIGSSAAGTLATAAQTLFQDWVALSGNLRIISAHSGAVFDPDDGNHFQMKVPVEYQYDFFVTP